MANRPSALAQLLKARRTELGLSRVRTAELVGMGAPTLESWELGKTAKPPIHDVLRLARFLKIPTEDIERAVLDDDGAPPVPQAPEPTHVVPLLDQAMSTLGWSEEDAARALSTSATRIAALRVGTAKLTVLDTMTLVARLLSQHGGDPSAEGLAASLSRAAETTAT